MTGDQGKPVRFDVRSTPIGRVADVSSIIGSIIHEVGPANARVSIFRHDPSDAPKDINRDDYRVWTDVRSHQRLTDMINMASTSDNANFRTFCEEHVFFVKCQPGSDHWMTTVPSSIDLVLKST